MTHLRIELSSNNEIVTSSLITKLYELAYAGLDASSNLKGYITATHAKRTLVEYLLNLYPELTINVTGEYYVEFADPNTEKLLMSTYNISGEGICPGDITQNSIHNMDGFNGHPSITSFNELPLFTSITKIAGKGLLGQDQLTSIDLQNITGIDNYSFLGCTRLASLGDTSNITYIYQQAFSGCAALTNLSFPSLTDTYKYAFENCTRLQIINIPWNLHRNANNSNNLIGLFYKCTALNSVPNFTLTKIWGAMFEDCGELQNIDLSNVTDMYSSAFRNCSKLNLSNCGLNWNLIQTINSTSISACKGVGEVELPSCTNTQLSYATFLSNPDFTKISNIPSITSCVGGGNISAATFESCPALRVIDLSKSTLLTKIYKWLYKNENNSTSAIEKIVLPSSILNISNDAFWITRKNSAPNFKGLICYATTPPTINNWDLTQTAATQLFNYYPTTAGIYVPASAVTDYKTAWADCASLIHSINEFPGEMEFVNPELKPNVSTYGSSAFNMGSTQEWQGAEWSKLKIISSNITTLSTGGSVTYPYAFMNMPNITFVDLTGCTGLTNASRSIVQHNSKNTDTYQWLLWPTTISQLGDNLALTNTRCRNVVLPSLCTDINTLSYSQYAFNDGIQYLYVPDQYLNDYLTSTMFSNFANKIKGMSELPNNIKEIYGIATS